MGEADLQQLMRMMNQLVIAAGNFVREENLFSVLVPTLSKDMDEQLKLAHKAVDKVDHANRKICVIPFVALQCGQAWKFLSTSPIFCNEGGGWEVSRNCLREL